MCTQIMASLQKVRVKGHTYWRIVESRRVDGKPRPVPVLHLGSADALLDRLRFDVDAEALDHLQREVFGKRILITDRHDWSDEEILQAYRGQSRVEDGFRQLEDDEHMAVRPQYHWTDQKIHVHTFLCLLGLLLGRVVEREARALGHTEGLSGLLDLLGTVRLALVLTPSGKRGGRPRSTWRLEQADPNALRLLRHLVPDKAPFVHTDGTS